MYESYRRWGVIEIRKVRKYFEGVKAIDGVSCTIKRGEIFGLIGPNGAGKTTLIRMIMNIIGPDSGEILFDGRKFRESDKERIGYLPEERGLYKKVRVRDMLLYLALLKGVRRELAKKSIEKWLERFDLGEWGNRKIETLSKGMAQKIQLIAALVHNPELIILDEPFSGLDPVSTDLSREIMLELGKNGKTIIFSTHNMEEAEKICTRILMLNTGKSLLYGKLEEIKSHFGRRSIALEFEGDLDFLKSSSLIESIIFYPRYAEIELKDRVTPDNILKLLVGKVRVKRFELMNPSLHKIFVDQVKHSGKSGG